MGALKERDKAILQACARYIRKQVAPIRKELAQLQHKGLAPGELPGSRIVTKEAVSHDGRKDRYRYDPSDGTWNLVR